MYVFFQVKVNFIWELLIFVEEFKMELLREFLLREFL